MFLTGPILNKINFDISKRLLFKLNFINRSHIIQELTYNLIVQSCELNIFKQLDDEFKNELLDTLFEFSSFESEVGIMSNELYKFLRNQ